MKLLAIIFLSIASIAVLVLLVLLASTFFFAGIGIDVPDGWPRRIVLYAFLHRWLLLAFGLLLLFALGRGIWRLAH